MPNLVAEYLTQENYEELLPKDFYREIFPVGSLEPQGVFETGLYTAIAVQVTRRRRFTITDDLNKIDELIAPSNVYTVISPISYAGKSRKSINARFMYALCVEIDNLIVERVESGTFDPVGLRNLLHQCKIEFLPTPTYIVASGYGIHLYYRFERPVALFPNVVKRLRNFKTELTRRLWNGYITTSSDERNIQYESLFQAFRMVGTPTKEALQGISDERARAFRFGRSIDIEYLNKYARQWQEFSRAGELQIPVAYQRQLSLEEAANKWPEWYEKRIVRKEPKGRWTCKRDLYDWWKKQILRGAAVTHRYYCLMILCIYAVKCRIEREEIEQDCFELMDFLNDLRDDKNPRNNHPFTEKDVNDALQCYDDETLVTYPINSIINRSGIFFEKNKRNGRKQEIHLARTRAVQNIDYPDGEWRNKEGRPNKAKMIEEWRAAHPDGKKVDCIRDTGLSRPTVSRWWSEKKEPSQVLVQRWRQENPNGTKSDCARVTGLSRPTVYKYWKMASDGETA